MLFLSKLTVKVFKRFDGVKYNYFNCSYNNNNKLLIRREIFYKNIFLSDIIDQSNNVILKFYEDDKFYYTFEDPRWINGYEFSFNAITIYKDSLVYKNCIPKKYNIITKNITHYDTKNAFFEKNWQFYKDYIIYSVNPFVILSEKESLFEPKEKILYTKNIYWDPWINIYNCPFLSSNVFVINDNNYLLFHSSIAKGKYELEYFLGILKLSKELEPLAYSSSPLVYNDYEDSFILSNKLFEFKSEKLKFCTKCNVFFPLNVSVDNNSINIYGGLNDCMAVKVSISLENFIKELQNLTWFLLV